METINEEKVYLKPGDVVKLRQNIRSPKMLVLRKETSLLKDGLKGIRCRWFTANYELQEAVFCTKDLIIVE